MKRIPRRIFTEEFKKEAVRLVQSEGLTMAEVARKLDVACVFQTKLDSDSTAKWTLIPAQSGH